MLLATPEVIFCVSRINSKGPWMDHGIGFQLRCKVSVWRISLGGLKPSQAPEDDSLRAMWTPLKRSFLSRKKLIIFFKEYFTFLLKNPMIVICKWYDSSKTQECANSSMRLGRWQWVRFIKWEPIIYIQGKSPRAFFGFLKNMVECPQLKFIWKA